jgi:hypothetical protein
MSEIYVKGPKESLEAFIQLVKDACGIDGWEQRFSVNWPGGTYYIARAFGINVRAMAADSVAFPDYDFWIIVSSRPRSRWDGNVLYGVAINIARNLVPYVTEVARPIYSETLRQDATIYRKSESGKYSVTQRMKAISDLPHWRIEVAEVSAGVYEVVARKASGQIVSAKGFNPDLLIEDCKRQAKAIGA